MKCFYHHDRDAVGTCKSCQRGVCPGCAVEFPRGLACRERCEEDAQALIALVDRNMKLSPLTQQMLRSTRERSFTMAGFYLVTGALFFGFGLRERLELSAVLGGCFLVYGAMQVLRTLKSPKIPGQE